MFDYAALTKRRNRAAKHWQRGNFIQAHLAQTLALRAQELGGNPPQRVLDLGCGGGEFWTQYHKHCSPKNPIPLWVNCDISEELLRIAEPRKTTPLPEPQSTTSLPEPQNTPSLTKPPTTTFKTPPTQRCLTAPESLPFGENSFDIVASINFLHWINQLPPLLAQIRHILAPKGWLLMTLPLRGLEPLNAAFEAVGLDPSSHFSPLVEMPTLAGLLSHTGFKEPVLDKQKVLLEYKEPFAIMGDLRASGQTNCLKTRSRALSPRHKMLELKSHFKKSITLEAEFIIAVASVD